MRRNKVAGARSRRSASDGSFAKQIQWIYAINFQSSTVQLDQYVYVIEQLVITMKWTLSLLHKKFMDTKNDTKSTRRQQLINKSSILIYAENYALRRRQPLIRMSSFGMYHIYEY